MSTNWISQKINPTHAGPTPTSAITQHGKYQGVSAAAQPRQTWGNGAQAGNLLGAPTFTAGMANVGNRPQILGAGVPRLPQFNQQAQADMWAKKQQQIGEQAGYNKGWITDKQSALDLGRTPDAGSAIQQTMAEIQGLGGKYNAAWDQTKAGTFANLTGLGGYGFVQDDPETPEREDLQITFKAEGINDEANLRFRQQAMENRIGAAQRGMMHSSFAKRNLASAFDKLSAEAQAHVSNHFGQIQNLTNKYSDHFSALTSQLTSQYGQAATWLSQNPPPPPPDEFFGEDGEPGVGGQVHGSWTAAPDFAVLRQRYPGYIFETQFDGERFTTIAKKPPGASQWDSNQWSGAAENTVHKVWSGYGKPDLEAIKRMYPDADITEDSIKKVEDEHGNPKYEVQIRKQYNRAPNLVMDSGTYVQAIGRGEEVVSWRGYSMPDMNAINGDMYHMSNNRVVEKKDKEGRTYYEVVSSPKGGGGGGGAPPPPSGGGGGSAPHINPAHLSAGRFTIGANRSQAEAASLAQRYSQHTGQHWSISKQGGQWVIYRK